MYMMVMIWTKIQSKNETANDRCENENLCLYNFGPNTMMWSKYQCEHAFKHFAVALAAVVATDASFFSDSLKLMRTMK